MEALASAAPAIFKPPSSFPAGRLRYLSAVSALAAASPWLEPQLTRMSAGIVRKRQSHQRLVLTYKCLTVERQSAVARAVMVVVGLPFALKIQTGWVAL